MKEIAAPESRARMEGRTLSFTLAPNKAGIEKQKAEEKKQAEAEAAAEAAAAQQEGDQTEASEETQSA